MFENKFEFLLPKGYLDEKGDLHRKGIMRLATAKDELNAMRNPNVIKNPDYATIVLLSSVITELGPYKGLTLEMLEKFYTVDMNFLQNLYEYINRVEDLQIEVTCPHCSQTFLAKANFRFKN